jgi:hypothetical protein
MASALLGGHGRSEPISAEHSGGAPSARPVRRQAHPLRSLRLEQLVPVAGLLALEPVRDSTPQLLGQERPRVALAGFFLQAGQRLLASGMGPEKEDRRFREGPRERGMADLGPGGPVALARRFFGPLDEAAIRDALLPAGAPLEVVDRLEQDEAQDVPEARHRLEEIQGVGGVRLRCLDEGSLESTAQRVRVPQQRSVSFHALRHGGVGQPLGDPVAVGLRGPLLPNLRPVVRTRGMLDGCEQCRPLAHERPPPPEQVTGGPHVCGRDRRLGQHAAAQQRRNLWGSALVVFGLAPVDGFHGERMPEPQGDALLSTQVGQPGPGAETFDRPPPGRHERVPRPGETVQERLAGSGAACSRHPGARDRRTGFGHAGQYRRNMGVVWWRIASGLLLSCVTCCP